MFPVGEIIAFTGFTYNVQLYHLDATDHQREIYIIVPPRPNFARSKDSLIIKNTFPIICVFSFHFFVFDLLIPFNHLPPGVVSHTLCLIDCVFCSG